MTLWRHTRKFFSSQLLFDAWRSTAKSEINVLHSCSYYFSTYLCDMFTYSSLSPNCSSWWLFCIHFKARVLCTASQGPRSPERLIKCNLLFVKVALFQSPVPWDKEGDMFIFSPWAWWPWWRLNIAGKCTRVRPISHCWNIHSCV